MATSSQGGVRSRTRWRRGAQATGISVAALTLGLGLSACGGGSSSGGSSTSSSQAQVSATQWASGVCSSIVSWGNQLQSSISKPPTGSGGVDLQQIKTSYVNSLGVAVSSTDTMISGVQALGAPAVSNGQAISQGLVSGLQQIRSAFVQAQSQAQALPTDNAGALNSGIMNLNNTITAAGNQVRTNLNSLLPKDTSNELSAAFTNQAACQPLKK